MIQLNIIPFTAPESEKQFAFYTEKKPGFYPIHTSDLFYVRDQLLTKDQQKTIKKLYTDFQEPREDAIIANIDLTESTYFANHYYKHLVHNYFKTVAEVVHPNFVEDVEIWIHEESESTDQYNFYRKYVIKIQHDRVVNGPELQIACDGSSKVWKQSVEQLNNFPVDLYNWMVCGKELHKFEYMPPHFKQDMNNIYPVLSNPLKKHFGLPSTIPQKVNKYIPYYNRIQQFYNKYLNTPAFKSILLLEETGFYNVPDNNVLRTKYDTNKLLFNNQKTDINPYMGIKNNGPYKVSPHNKVRFFFIGHENDKKDAILKLYNIFRDGYKDNYGNIKFQPLNSFIKQPFETEQNASIYFTSLETAFQEIKDAIKNKELDDSIRYVAIYVSPVSKMETDEAKSNLYYQIKELLLEYDITSQVIYKENIFNPAFNFFLPNIAIALLAKLDGVPWRLNRETSNELIVGIGAFYSSTTKTKYVGSAFCFSNEGIFAGFDCFRSNDIDSLAGSIRKAVMRYLVDHEKADRLVIHFYKTMSKKELRPIMETMHKLGLNIPVIVITINKTESKELIGFDLGTPTKLPVSGSIIPVGRNQYLLFNNTRYDESSTVKDHPFPIKLTFSASDKQILNSIPLLKELIDEVYQFSRMYWKSVSQQNLPVTIKYPEMVAEIYPHFSQDKIPEFGRENLWFL